MTSTVKDPKCANCAHPESDHWKKQGRRRACGGPGKREKPHVEKVLNCSAVEHEHRFCSQRLDLKTGETVYGCRLKEHTHGDACYVNETTYLDAECECGDFDGRSPQEIARDNYLDAMSCASCSHPPETHPEYVMRADGRRIHNVSRHCRAHIPNPGSGSNGATTMCVECRGYLPRAEAAELPPTRPSAWGPREAETAARVAKRDEAFEALLAKRTARVLAETMDAGDSDGAP